ncbi:MAG: sigma-54-dependent transcriptional regulator, partial [Myxococcota bacterium]
MAGAARNEGRPRVLVVDDAEGIRTYLANLLELKGYSVDTAEDGRRALALLEGGANPDVILLDVMMPGSDGIDTLRRLREKGDAVPVVMLSVVGKASTIVEAMRLGASDYLNKPFEEEDLLLTLQAVLETKALRDERDRLASEMIPQGDSIVWASESMNAVRELLAQVADTDVTVL